MGVVVEVKARACPRARTALVVAWRLRSIANRAIVVGIADKSRVEEKKVGD